MHGRCLERGTPLLLQMDMSRCRIKHLGAGSNTTLLFWLILGGQVVYFGLGLFYLFGGYIRALNQIGMHEEKANTQRK